MTVGQPYLWAEVARQTCIFKIRATCVHPYALSILRGILRSDCHVKSISLHDLNDIISTVFRWII